MAGRAPSSERPAAPQPIRLKGAHAGVLDVARNRLLVTGTMFALAFLVVAGRLVDLTVFGHSEGRHLSAAQPVKPTGRGDIIDRNGVLLATSLPTASVYANPSDIVDPDAVARQLGTVFPGLDQEKLVQKLASDGQFVWVRRNLTPDEQFAVHRLGIPGVGFLTEERRVYPQGTTAAHILGYTDVDGQGIAGVEKSFDGALVSGESVQLSVDARIQAMLREELMASVTTFRATGAAALVFDVHTGEIVAMVSLPDFDPNAPTISPADTRFNRATKGVYEMGSTFKLFTVAMALDTGTVKVDGGYDASKPLRVARHTIRDFHAENRWLSVPEILIHSSNIGAALMARDVGTAAQKAYLQRLGLRRAAPIELPEVGRPLEPATWRELNTMTIGFGHGLAVSPLQLASAVAAVVNGGILRKPTILRQDKEPAPSERVITAKTSESMRHLMREVVEDGTGKKADVAGYRVGGKTGTAEKLIDGRYRSDKRLSSFVGAFPMDDPQYVVLVAVDEPKGTKQTFNYATGGWVAAPVVSHLIARMAPMVGIAPAFETPTVPVWNPGQPSPNKPLFVAIKNAISEARGQPLAAN